MMDYDLVSQLLSYQPDTGKMFWLKRDRSLFSDDRSCSVWNARFAGEEAFVTHHSAGYLTATIFGRTYLAHRVAWLLAHGGWPKDRIDHIDGNRANNCSCNLRDVSHQENMRNQRIGKSNQSGAIGVFRCKSGRWIAQIHSDHKIDHLGTFNTFFEAALARKVAEARHGFHVNHGRL